MLFYKEISFIATLIFKFNNSTSNDTVLSVILKGLFLEWNVHEYVYMTAKASSVIYVTSNKLSGCQTKGYQASNSLDFFLKFQFLSLTKGNLKESRRENLVSFVKKFAKLKRAYENTRGLGCTLANTKLN